MKVRILSGSQAGQVVEQSRPEAESNIASGFAELVVDEPAAKPAAKKPKASAAAGTSASSDDTPKGPTE